MKKNQLKNTIKKILVEELGYSKFTDSGKTDGLTKDTLDKILLRIANGSDDGDSQPLDENSQPKVIFNIYEHIINKVRDSSFEGEYPTASSFFQDIKHIID